MSFSFRQVRYFLATAATGRISAAAANLGVSQSAITAAIKALERELDARLFDRNSNGVSLTYVGHQFLQQAKNIEAAVLEATRATKNLGADTAGDARVGVTYTVAGYFFPQILARFVRSFPGITLQIREIPRVEIEAGIVAGDLDAAVMLVSNIENKQEIQSEILIRSRRRLWLCADHPLLREDAVPLSRVAEEPYVMLTVDEAKLTAMRYWEKTTYRPRIIFDTASVEAVRSMIATGMGVTILSDMVYRPWSLEGQRIELRPVTGNVPTMDVGLAWRRGANLSPATRAFIEFLSVSFGGSGHRFADTPN